MGWTVCPSMAAILLTPLVSAELPPHLQGWGEDGMEILPQDRCSPHPRPPPLHGTLLGRCDFSQVSCP